ncbi:Cytokinin dehydrogenase [Quillaja saponaria]|uniref:cytokinin dehydrogenase n=1 Tax=Quillaja saponaria TaxID=32244 RepID=A0AAD7QD84_QUISA|nr:Cytokinin dehydrogenase [Quillaja saponaria]
MAEIFPFQKYFIVIIISIIHLITSTIGKTKPWTNILLPPKLSDRFLDDPESIKLASSDYGNLVQEIPAAIFNPSSINDIVSLIKFSNSSSIPFNIAARGQGHSTCGQAMAGINGVVINMASYRKSKGAGIEVSSIVDSSIGKFYADVGGEQLWIDVLHATLEHGLTPVSWTDYLYLTVGGTLSNAGISGQTFRYGPQISNVYEMDVVTGKGDFVTCSSGKNSELFFAVLGGLGQFGIITRARIGLEPAPKRVKWVRMLYNDFSAFAKDQEYLISNNGRNPSNTLNYLEGLLLMHQGPPDNWRSSFFPLSDHSRIISLLTKHSIIYCLEVVKYYDDHTQNTVNEELKVLFQGLSYIPGLIFEKNVSYLQFLNRVRSGELKLQSQGLWDVPHPWLNLFLPKSCILDFDSSVFKEIILKRNITTGPVLIYPMNRSKWDDKMSVVIPDEDVFYTVAFLHSSGFDDWEAFDIQNREILQFCEIAGIQFKQYLPHYKRQQDWEKHFGKKWRSFKEKKSKFDPRNILSPGQRIFNHNY